ncbi:MAG TPA: polyprenyl diphosphate synthase [Mariprofundaceae bacterium]|nr:polyprenyl diphosphate synthase [Mariprofundaceae bacterium]
MASSTLVLKPTIPCHVGIVMDGNGRWAKARGKRRLDGHREGAARARDIVEWADDLGIKQLSLFAFSTENWERPKLEVRGLMGLLSTLLPREVPMMLEKNVRLRVLGDITALPSAARRAVDKACAETRQNTGITLILCLNYGGQQEIIAGVQDFARKLLASPDPESMIDKLNPEALRTLLWRHDLAPVDLLIRTGGEKRISNFHLWDAAYAELFFTDCLWPDFSRQELEKALHDYASRERRFGKTSEQLST